MVKPLKTIFLKKSIKWKCSHYKWKSRSIYGITYFSKNVTAYKVNTQCVIESCVIATYYFYFIMASKIIILKKYLCGKFWQTIL